MKNILLLSFILLWTGGYASVTDTITIHSQVLHVDTKCVVITPDSYSQYPSIKFPVVYLLHGYSGNYSNWVTKVPEIKQYSDKFQMIIVCPDGKNSWYINSPESNYAGYIGLELPSFIDSVYNTIRDRRFRAIAGLSMGGAGAIYLSIQYPEMFGMAGSMSGALDLVPLRNSVGLTKVIGDTSIAVIEKYSDLQLINKADTSVQYIIDCGVGDSFIDTNRRFHEKMLQLKIPHDYTERPGGHTWDYWRNAIEYQLLFFRKGFNEAGK